MEETASIYGIYQIGSLRQPTMGASPGWGLDEGLNSSP